jgi:hypothetical protein
VSRVVFTGAHGTGKTVLLNILLEAGQPKGHYFYDSYGRTLKKYGTLSAQRKFNYHYIKRHYFNKNFVDGRAIYDAWAYTRVQFDPWYHSYLFCWALKHIYYDYVFYIPIEFPLEKGDRKGGSTDVDLQRYVDKQIKLMLDFYNIPHHTLTGSVEHRILQIKNIMDLPRL